jgi:hypothetical protein
MFPVLASMPWKAFLLADDAGDLNEQTSVRQAMFYDFSAQMLSTKPFKPLPVLDIAFVVNSS